MNSHTKNFLRPFLNFALAIGFDPRRIISWRHSFTYIKQYKEFLTKGGAINLRRPILVDYTDSAGSSQGHYFHQDLLVASMIFNNNPIKHIDIGSRIDGFVAHVASFRPIEVMDIRDLPPSEHKNISFLKADLMNRDPNLSNITDSISCLHAIEHFGLGRYGDNVDPNGHKTGFNNILHMLKTGGTLYISFPIGEKNSVHFNSQRIFEPKDIFLWAENPTSLQLQQFDYIDDNGNLHQFADINSTISNIKYGCGVYTFKKIF